jgi:anaerobic ribonucleoside-triphosphate reductase activating protein
METIMEKQKAEAHDIDFNIDFAGCAGGVEGLGPGKRAVMWVRGCTLACPGCMTPELWATGSPRDFTSIEQVANRLRPLLQNGQRLSISGGEPMQQPTALKNLVQLLRAEFRDLEVLVYSGYSLEELLNRGQSTTDFLEEIDILIDQPYEEAASNLLQWRGSDNQRVHYLSSRSLRQAKEQAKKTDESPEERSLQMQMLGNGQFRLIGIPKRGDMERYRQMMAQRGLMVKKSRLEP